MPKIRFPSRDKIDEHLRARHHAYFAEKSHIGLHLANKTLSLKQLRCEFRDAVDRYIECLKTCACGPAMCTGFKTIQEYVFECLCEVGESVVPS